VSRAIEILTADLNRTLRLLGCASLADLDPSMVEVPFDFAQGSRRLSGTTHTGQKLETEGDGRASADIH
jgi:hypothetical protein